MIRSIHLQSLPALMMTTLFSLSGWAQTVAPPPRDLYQEALQSIAEGRKNDASEALTHVIDQEPLHAGAWLDLALIQCSLGHADEAERLFSVIEARFKPPKGIVDLIAQARAQGCDRWQPHSQWSLLTGRGIDQNVNQGASNPVYIVKTESGQNALPLLPDFLPKHDQYTIASADYARDITPNGSIGFAQFQARRNDHLHAYDSASLFTGMETPWRFGRWTLRSTEMLGVITLGGAAYQRQAQIQARVGPPIALPGKTQVDLMVGLTHIDYMTLTNFNSNMFEVRSQFNYRNGNSAAGASFSYLEDRSGALRPGGNRHGTLITIQGRRQLSDLLSGELTYNRQTWLSQSPYAPGLISEIRDQTTHVLRSALNYSLDKNQTLQLELRQVHNRDNISIFQYNNHQLQLSWQWKGL